MCFGTYFWGHEIKLFFVATFFLHFLMSPQFFLLSLKFLKSPLLLFP